MLLAVWSYSQYPFTIALPDETTGSILHGLVCALEFFDCVPAELWWDNPTTVAKAILRGRDRQLKRYSKFYVPLPWLRPASAAPAPWA